jgi:hypothetical protein
MKTIMSRHFPPLPIDINYNCEYKNVEAKDMGRILAALKRPDRIRGILFTGKTAELQKLFRASKCPFPALKSLKLCVTYKRELKIPAGFLKGSDLQLRSLKLHHIYLPSISRFLSSAPALTDLSLRLDTVGTISVMSYLLSHFQGMPCLRHLDLEIDRHIEDLGKPTMPKENFPLSKLTSFRYHGHSAYLNAFMAGFAAPSLQKVDIRLFDRTLPPILDLSRLIEDTGKHYHVVQVVLDKDFLRFLSLPLSKFVADYHSRCFKLRTKPFPESIMQMSSAFSAKLATAEELFVFYLEVDDVSEDIPWRRFLLQFPRVKTLRLDTCNLQVASLIASALNQDHGEPDLALLPALEEIELCLDSYMEHKPVPELEAFQPFVSARQQAGFPPVRVFSGPHHLSALTRSLI